MATDNWMNSTSATAIIHGGSVYVPAPVMRNDNSQTVELPDAAASVDRSQRQTEPCEACHGQPADHHSASAPPDNINHVT